MTHNHQQQHERKARQALMKAQTNRDKARRKLLRQREQLARRRAYNRHQSERQRDNDGDGTANPTAHSTLPRQKSNAARNSHSTVPAVPKYSKVPARERLYGAAVPKYSAVPARERLYGVRLHEKTAKATDASVHRSVPRIQTDEGGSSDE